MGNDYVHWTYENRTQWLSARPNTRTQFTPFDSYTELPYDTSYDWSMSVIEKIEETNYVKIIRNFCGINKTKQNEFNQWITYEGGELFFSTMTKNEAIFKACVKFVKWYNETKTI